MPRLGCLEVCFPHSYVLRSVLGSSTTRWAAEHRSWGGDHRAGPGGARDDLQATRKTYVAL